ncbi:MAG: WHG domain-containing protein [Pseudomonadota bacterium]
MRERLVEAAWARIARSGLHGLTAREIAADASCAVGSIYTVFEDLDELAIHANLKSLELLGGALVSASAGTSGTEALRSLALAYARFAVEHRLLWDALFDLRLAQPTPPEFVEANSGLLGLIGRALREIPVVAPPDDLAARSRTYFAAVHGIVFISLQGRFVGHPPDNLASEVDAFVALLARGLESEAVER